MITDPAPNIQYSQYADRDVRLRRDARHAKPVTATKPLQNPPEFRLQGKERAGGRNLKMKRVVLEKVKTRNEKGMQLIRQELTGQGIHIDVKV